MKKIQHLKLKVLVVAMGLAATGVQAAGVTAGDLLIYRIGTGAAALTSAATSVFLDEYNTSGTLIQSIAMPSAVIGSNKILTASGTASSEGELTISPNGQYVTLTGYNAVAGTLNVAGTASSAVNRTVGIYNVATGNIDTTTALTDAATTGNNIRSAVTTNGNDIWLAGAAGGVRYTTDGATTSTQLSTTPTNIRQVEIFNGQLFASDSSGTAIRLGTVGTGEPTTAGQTITNLPGFATATGSPYSFFLTHLNGTGTDLDTLYVADDGIGITKYSLANSTWVSNGTVGAAADTYRGLTGVVNGSTVNLFATGSGGTAAAGGGKLVSITDSSGYNAAFTASATTLATAANQTAFRGVVYVPSSIAAVPVPGAIWLFGSALLGMIGFKRRKV